MIEYLQTVLLVMLAWQRSRAVAESALTTAVTSLVWVGLVLADWGAYWVPSVSGVSKTLHLLLFIVST